MSTQPSSSGPFTLVVMGVSGSGKTSVAEQLVTDTGYAFAEGDDLHPESNRKKMADGHPLTDEDRWPWLHRVAGWIGEQEAAGRGAVVTCSALKRVYREILVDGHPSVRFVHLVVPREELERRLAARKGHYMPASLLQSQLDTLEDLHDDEPGVSVDTTGSPMEVAHTALDRLGIAPDREPHEERAPGAVDEHVTIPGETA